jgi:hypothetical protein
VRSHVELELRHQRSAQRLDASGYRAELVTARGHDRPHSRREVDPIGRTPAASRREHLVYPPHQVAIARGFLDGLPKLDRYERRARAKRNRAAKECHPQAGWLSAALDRLNRPSMLVVPVLLSGLRLLASICRTEVMSRPAKLGSFRNLRLRGRPLAPGPMPSEPAPPSGPCRRRRYQRRPARAVGGFRPTTSRPR